MTASLTSPLMFLITKTLFFLNSKVNKFIERIEAKVECKGSCSMPAFLKMQHRSPLQTLGRSRELALPGRLQSLSPLSSLYQGMENVFCIRPGSKYFRLRGPFGLC